MQTEWEKSQNIVRRSRVRDRLFKSEFILIFVFLLFIVYGPGKVSIDHFIARKYGFSNKRA
jgi:uncharacterized membrane protein YphA (DoxX/SURF4 family)